MTGFYKIRNLRKHYSPGDVEQMPAIDIEALDIALGGIIAIVGGSGSGKTTLLNLLGGLEPGDHSISRKPLLELQLPHEPTIYKLARKLKFSRKVDIFPHHKVSYVFQQGYLLNHASIGLNLAMTRRAAGLPVDNESLESLLELAQLNDTSDPTMPKKRLSDRAITLSGGQQQRINIARALGRNPRLIYADELSSSLDPNTAREVMSKLRGWIWATEEDQSTRSLAEPLASGPEEEMIRSRTSLSRSMLWVTHDYALVSEFADAVIVLTEGRLAKNCESPVELDKSRTSSQNKTLETGILEWVQSGEVPDRSSEVEDRSVSFELGPTDSDRLQGKEKAIVAGSKPHTLSLLPGTENIIGSLGSGIALSWMEAFHQPAVSKWSALNWLSSLLRPAFGFTHWVRAIQLSAILALIAIIVYGQKEVIQYFDQQLRDPSLRHVIVNQNLREITRSRIDDDSLIELSKKLNSFDVINDTDENVAFGRHTEDVDVYPAGFTGTITEGYVPEITIGIIDADEPVYSLEPVFPLDESSPGCDRERTALPAELIKSPTDPMLIVTTDYIERVRKMFGVDLCLEPFLELHDAGEPRTFQIAGFIDKTPADGFTYFDAVMQVDTWKTWVSLVGKPAWKYYPRASVYFTQQNHSAVIDELRERAFAFDQEIISKFERLMSSSAQLRNTFLVITWLALVVAITVAAGLIWSYLAQNAKSIAVLRAHDAWFWPLLAAIPFQLLLTFIYALFYLAIVTFVWNQLVDLTALQYFAAQVSAGAWKPSAISYAMIQPALPWIGASLIAMIAVGIICLFMWRITHRKLAHELRQAY